MPSSKIPEINALLSSLKADNSIQLEKEFIGANLPEYDSLILSSLNIKIPPKLLAFYEKCNGFHISWSANSNTLNGEICIVPLNETFIGHWKDILWYEWMDEKTTDAAEAGYFSFAKMLKGFDVLKELLDKTVVVALEPKEDEQDGYRLWYWDNKGPKFPLRLNAMQYIEEAIRYKGALRWQYFFADLQAIKLNDPFLKRDFGNLFSSFLETMEEWLPEYKALFPVQDLKELEKALEELKSFGDKHKLLP